MEPIPFDLMAHRRVCQAAASAVFSVHAFGSDTFAIEWSGRDPSLVDRATLIKILNDAVKGAEDDKQVGGGDVG